MSNNPLSNLWSLTENNDNNIEAFIVSNVSDNKSYPGRLYRKSETVSTSQINGYFGWEGLLLNTPDVRADTLGWLPTSIFSIGWWNVNIAGRLSVIMSIRHWSWFIFWGSLPMNVKWEKQTQACETRIFEQHPCPNWKGQFSRVCTGVIGATSLIQTHSS